MIHKCNDNDTVIHFNIVDGELKELLVKSIGDKSWIVIGYKDLRLGLEKVFIKQEKEIDLTNYEPEKWLNYNVDCQEQYEVIYNLKSKIKNEP